MKDWSQGGEQLAIQQYFGDRIGHLLDCAAHDGQTLSNTYALVQGGWSGVFVEPAPGPFLKLLDRHGDNARHQLFNVALDPSLLHRECELRTFHDARGDLVGSLSDEHVQKWKGAVNFRGYTVAAVSVPALLAACNNRNFDFVNIDIEGYSEDLLGEMIACEVRPRLFCVEHDGHADRVAATLREEGYQELMRNGENIVAGI